jgi:hypothetical protein
MAALKKSVGGKEDKAAPKKSAAKKAAARKAAPAKARKRA